MTFSRALTAVPIIVLALGYLAYVRSEYVAPYFVSPSGCGPVKVDIKRVNLSSGAHVLQRSFPVNNGGDPIEERYMNAVALNLVQNINGSGLANSRGRKPFRLNILFVQSDSGLSTGSRFDGFGNSPRLTSPWVRIVGNDWSPCTMGAIFFRQGRQIARDQMEMLAGKPITWEDRRDLSESQMAFYREEYVREVLSVQKPSERLRKMKEIEARIPADVIFAFYNSPQQTIGYPGVGFHSLTQTSSQGFSNHVNAIVDRYFSGGGQKLTIADVTQSRHEDTGYELSNLRRL
ncbi:hypothetical protein MZO42_17655 [Sphingomonas psychrotolerans]|uniref:Uncharacterized protein n=1 Tax=Sphingomonas psychrotolerans TaxID=1327635 RepID=A0ABU3N7P3_9SPHN|nr:hypothetical protein [Sphingomonas psychrotolerans]MDT8760530.1 hypothetical protein [Sphingomonas psychrotolerans]